MRGSIRPASPFSCRARSIRTRPLSRLGQNAPREHTKDGKAWTWAASGRGLGDSLEVTLQLPRLVAAGEPAWQDAGDRREQLIRERSPQLNLLFLGLGLLITVGGGLAVLAAWWTCGRGPRLVRS